jgi:hypothetical protein
MVSALAATSVFVANASALADGELPPVVTQVGLPPTGELPSVNGGCYESADTGWVCPPDTSDPTQYLYDDVTGPGALPGATDPDAFTVDPAQLSAKEQLAVESEAAVTLNLAGGVNEQPPTDDEIPTSPGPHEPPGGSPPAADKVAFTGYSQDNHPWCVGASTATMLSTFGVTSDVASIEKAEGYTTKLGGTPMGNARPYLNKHQSTIYYYYDQAGSAAQLFTHVSDDVWGYGAAVMIAVGTQGLSWWKSSSRQGLHVLTVYAYHSQSHGGFSVWDSGYAKAYGISLVDTWKAMALDKAGDAEIW